MCDKFAKISGFVTYVCDGFLMKGRRGKIFLKKFVTKYDLRRLIDVKEKRGAHWILKNSTEPIICRSTPMR